MARSKKTAKGKRDDSSRPSTFFIIALILGFVVLVWWFMHFLPKKAAGEKEGRSGVVELAELSDAPRQRRPLASPTRQRGGWMSGTQVKGAA